MYQCNSSGMSRNAKQISKSMVLISEMHGKLFDFPMLVAADDRYEYEEDRWIGIGMLEGRTLVVIFTERGDDTIRIISMMKALSHEKIRYEQYLGNRLGHG